tara:strand:- start:964 stop:1935 length:972 start_codon:yes stop_codon:yes gene_type:complete
MTKYVVTSGDYHIKTNDAGSIFLDTGNQIGQVYMTGNLVVKGTTTQVDATNLDLKDNIIVLNSGEQGAGVSLSTAGIEIDRGSKPNTQFVFDETVSWNDPVTQTIKQGGFKTRDINGGNIGLEVRSISTGGGDLYLINAGTGVISVSGTNAYENQVTDDDDIPNKKYVDVQIAAQVAAADFQKIRDGSSSFTEMVVADFETTGLTSVASITVDGVNNVNFYDNRSELHDLRIDGSRISTTTSNADLTLSAPGTGSVVIDDQLQILTTPSPDDSAVDPAQPTDGLKIYAKSQGVGKTGLYYVNSNNVRDEIISKNRSLLLSMIF